MKSADGSTHSCWYDSIDVPAYPPLEKSDHADVVIVGAGIAGLSAAYLLLAEGKSVIVIDEGPVGSGQTGRTSAHLASVTDDRFVHAEKLHGVEGAKLIHQSHAAAIDRIEKIVIDEKIDCDFTRLDGVLTRAAESSPDILDQELAAAERAGVVAVEKQTTGGLSDAPCLRFGRQARFQPMKFLVGLARAFTARGGRLHTGQRVKDVQGADPAKHKAAVVTVNSHIKVTADHVIVATNTPAPINDWFGIYTKQASYRTYVVTADVPRGSVEDVLNWDTADPYHYVRVQPGVDSDLLIIGGEDHKVGQLPRGDDPFGNLHRWAKPFFPVMGEIRHRWSGQVQEPADGVAFIGRALTAKENVFVITGDSGMGLTHGMIGGLLITDQIMGRSSPWEKLYDPSRKILNRDFLAENTNTVVQYKDLITSGDVKSADDIAPGQGAILREGLHKLAVYRDDAGKVHRCSAICTHLQCVVAWNPIEKSWDCPCHGSRFDALGKVLMGPAVEDLPKA